MFVAALFKAAPPWKQTKYVSTRELIKTKTVVHPWNTTQ